MEDGNLDRPPSIGGEGASSLVNVNGYYSSFIKEPSVGSIPRPISFIGRPSVAAEKGRSERKVTWASSDSGRMLLPAAADSSKNLNLNVIPTFDREQKSMFGEARHRLMTFNTLTDTKEEEEEAPQFNKLSRYRSGSTRLRKWAEAPSAVPFSSFPHYLKEIDKRRFYLYNHWRVLPGDDVMPRYYPPETVPPNFTRYADIGPFAHNRVIVPIRAEEPERGNYFNASHITCPEGEQRRIACECPMPDALNAFWNMLVDQKVGLIVMLTEALKSKNCPAYWPLKQKGFYSRTKGELSLRVAKVSETKVHEWKLPIVLTAGKEAEIVEIVIMERKLEMWEQATPTQKHYVTHIQFSGWPDRGAPVTEAFGPFNTFMEYYRKLRTSLPPDGSILCHCSAGVGRTGTFLALDLILDQIAKNDAQTQIDVFGVVVQLRKDRMQMVQTDEQFAFIHKFIEYRWNLIGVKPGLPRVATINKDRQLAVLKEFETYNAFLKTTPAFVVRARLITCVKNNLATALKQAYQHQLKSALYHYWRGMIKTLLELFDRDTKWHLEFIYGLIDRGSITTLTALVGFIEAAVELWSTPDATEADLWVAIHTCELDIYCCCRDMLEQTKLLTPRSRMDESEERKFLLLENRLDRLFWYRFFLRRSEVDITDFARVLRLYLEVGPHPETISLTHKQFQDMVTNCMVTPNTPQPTKITPRSYSCFLERYGQLGNVYRRMMATCLCNGTLAPWFRPELSREFVESRVQFPERGFNFLLRLSSDNKTFVLHSRHGGGNVDPDEVESKAVIPLKIHLDAKGYFWERLANTNQRLDDLRELLYKYVLEVRNTYREERTAIDKEMKDWADQDQRYSLSIQALLDEESREQDTRKKHRMSKTATANGLNTLGSISGLGSLNSSAEGSGSFLDARGAAAVIKREETPLQKLGSLFFSRVFQDDFFDVFHQKFRPCHEEAASFFGYVDNDKNTVLDSHEIRVGLFLLFSPLMENLLLSQLIHGVIRNQLQDETWTSRQWNSELSVQKLGAKLIQWLPVPSNQLFNLDMLKGEISRVAAKLCSHTMEVVTSGADFKAIGTPGKKKRRETELQAIAIHHWGKQPFKTKSIGAKMSETNYLTTLRVDNFPKDEASSDKASVEHKADAFIAATEEKQKKRDLSQLLNGWQKRRDAKRTLARRFKEWIDILITHVTSTMAYRPPPVSIAKRLLNAVQLFVEMVFLPISVAFYISFTPESEQEKVESQFRKGAKAHRVTAQALVGRCVYYSSLVVFVLVFSVIYYGGWLGWVAVYSDRYNMTNLYGGGPFHWFELALPLILWAMIMAVVIVSEYYQTKLPEQELKWEAASLTVRQTEVSFRSLRTHKADVEACERMCLDGKEGYHHVSCPVLKRKQTPWDCLPVIAEDFLTWDVGKNETPWQTEAYLRFLYRHLWLRFRSTIRRKKVVAEPVELSSDTTPFDIPETEYVQAPDEFSFTTKVLAVGSALAASGLHAAFPGVLREFHVLYNENCTYSFFGNFTPTDSFILADNSILAGNFTPTGISADCAYHNNMYISIVALNFFSTFVATFLFLIMLIAALSHYSDVRRALKRVLALADAEKSFVKFGWPHYLSLEDHHNNLLFWTKVRDHAKSRVDSSVLIVYSVALIFDVFLVARLIYVLVANQAASTLFLNAIGAFQIVVLTVPIILLFNIVVDLNTEVKLETTIVLQTLKLTLSQKLKDMEEARSRQLAYKGTMIYDQRYTPVLILQMNDRSDKTKPALATSYVYQADNDDIEELADKAAVGDSASNKFFCHPKDAREAGRLELEERRAREKQENDIREMAAFVKLTQASIDRVLSVELPIEILGLSIDKNLRTRAIAALATGVVTVAFQLSNTSS